jgi:predicted phage tail protein
MKTRGLGRSIMVAGAVCIMFYTLLAIWSVSTFNAGVGNLLFYVGVVIAPLGVILLLTEEMKRRRE